MSSKYDKIIKNFVQSIRESDKRGTSPYDTTAEVLRVDGDTAWVHIAGGVDETPVKKTIDCKPGDVVQLRVGGGRAWITGNATAPPTDDTKANKANETALSANKRAITAYKTAEAEARDRKLIIREVAAGIEVGFENGGFKALINGEGSFDVVDAAGDTVASFGTNAVLKSTKTDSSGTTTSTMTIMPEGMMIDQDLPDHSVWENRQQANITPYGIKLTDFSQGDSKPTFQLDQYVCGVWGTPIVRDWETMELGNMDGNCYCSGYITGSSKKLRFTMPLTVPISYRSKLEFDYLKVTVRQNNKYLLGDADTPFSIPVEDDTKFTCEVYDTGVNILYDSASAFSGATNNDACGIYVEYSMTPTEIST